MMTSVNGSVYDAHTVSQILGLPVLCKDLPPEAREGDLVVYYGGWDLKELRTASSGAERKMDQDQTWYDGLKCKADPGYYRLLLPVPFSNGKDWNQQITLLQAMDQGWQAAPVAVCATALLVHTAIQFPYGKWLRCAEPLPERVGECRVGGGRVSLSYSHAGIHVFADWGAEGYGDTWLAAASKC